VPGESVGQFCRVRKSRRTALRAPRSSSHLASQTVQVASEATARPIITSFTMMSAWRNMPHGERSCGNSAVLIEVSPGGGAAAGVRALAPDAAAFAGFGSATGATPLVACDCATCDVAAGGSGGSADAGDGLATVAGGATTDGDVENGAAGVVAGVCAAVATWSGAWVGGRGRTGAGVVVWA
jgi:hypothetical protein